MHIKRMKFIICAVVLMAIGFVAGIAYIRRVVPGMAALIGFSRQGYDRMKSFGQTFFNSSFSGPKKEYQVEEDDPHYFFSLKNPAISIRTVSNKKGSKDILYFHASLPHGFKAEDREAMLESIKQLVDIDFLLNTHGLKISKSPAAQFGTDLKETILEYLFSYLHKKYESLPIKQQVIFKESNNEDVLGIECRPRAKNYVELVNRLEDIDGLRQVNLSSGETVVQTLPEDGLLKFEDIAWGEIIPRMKEIFLEHFSGKVEFIERQEV